MSSSMRPASAGSWVRDALAEKSAQVDLVMDWLAHPPTIPDIGPVLFPAIIRTSTDARTGEGISKCVTLT
jgi:hypothetical protein